MTVADVLQAAKFQLEFLLKTEVNVMYAPFYKVSPHTVLDACAEYFNVSVSEVKGHRKNGMLPSVRQCMAYICIVKLNYRVKDIACVINKHHANVIISRDKAIELLSINDNLMTNAIISIEKKLFLSHAPEAISQ